MVERLGQQLGNYRLVKRLGNGGFAEVYIGEHIYLKNEVAIKVLYAHGDEVDVEAFSQEGRMLVRLLHPHIIRVLDFGVEDGTAFLVMDYAPNGTLRRQYPPGSHIELPLVVKYIRQVASALQYAHDQKLIHRDVKPENMLLDKNNDVLLTDFGVAIIAQSTHDFRLQQREAAGTIAYMAPESVQAHPRAASDQYALAIVAYEWLCGTRPFTGSFMEIAAKHALTEPPPLRQYAPDLPPAVERVILTALAKAPEDRFASVQAFAEALEKAALDPEGDTVALPVAPRSERKASSAVYPESLHQEPPYLAPSPAALATPPTSLPPVRVRSVETPPPRTTLPPRRNGTARRRWPLLLAFLVLLLLFSSIGLIALLSSRGSAPGSGGLATATSAKASPVHTAQATPTSEPTREVTPSPVATATLPPIDAIPTVGGSYNGPIHNTPANVGSTMVLQIEQQQARISGQFTVNMPLSGSGPFTGNVSAGNKIQFTVHSSDIPAPLFFTGTVASDHSMSGDYCSLNAQGKCDKNAGGYGTWRVSKS